MRKTAIILAALAMSGVPAWAQGASGSGMPDRQQAAGWISTTRPGQRCITSTQPGAKPDCVKIGGPNIGYDPVESMFGTDGKPGGAGSHW